MKKNIVVILFMLSLLGFHNSYGQQITKPIQEVIDKEINFQKEKMKESKCCLMHLVNDMPELSITLNVSIGWGREAGSLKIKTYSPMSGAVVRPAETPKYASIFPGEIKIDDNIVSKLASHDGNLTDLINKNKPANTVSPSVFDNVDISKEINSFYENGQFNTEDFNKHFGCVIFDDKDLFKSINLNDEYIKEFDKEIKKLLADKLCTKINKFRQDFLALKLGEGKIPNGLDKENAKISDYIDRINWINEIVKKYKGKDPLNYPFDNKDKRFFEGFFKKYSSWQQNRNNLADYINLIKIRSTIIHELCHPLTTLYYSGIAENVEYYEGVNVLISCAYEIEQGYFSTEEGYLARYGKDNEYPEYYNKIKDILGYQEPKVPSFKELILLDNLAVGKQASPEKTLATALTIIKKYSALEDENYKNYKIALREILKQYICADTAEDRNNFVDAILKEIKIEGRFNLVYEDDNGVKKLYLNSYVLRNQNGVTGIYSAEIESEKVNNNSVYRIKIISTDKKGLAVFYKAFEPASKDLHMWDVQKIYDKISSQDQKTANESTRQTYSVSI